MASGSVNLGPDTVSGGGGGSGNATSIQGIPVIATPPSNGQVLAYNSSNGDYEPISPSGSGTVTSVGLVDSTGIFTVTGSPVTGSGSLTLSALASQSANTFLAAPNGAPGASAFRAIVAVDVPTLNQNTSGTAANITASSNSTLTTLSALSLPGAQVAGNISGNAANVTASSNSTLTTLSALSLPASQVTNIAVGLVESFGISIDGGGSAISNGTYAVRSMPTAGVITSWVLLADVSGSITVDIKKSTFSGYNTTTSITAAAIPALSSVIKNQSSTLTGWTTSFSAGDVMQFVVSGASTVTKITLTVLYTRA